MNQRELGVQSCPIVLVKPIQVRLNLRADHSLGDLLGVLHPIQGASIQNVDGALSIDQNFGHSTVVVSTVTIRASL